MLHNGLWLKIRGNFSLMLDKESWLQTSWWNIKTNLKTIKLQNDYATVGIIKVSNEAVTSIFLIPKMISILLSKKRKQYRNPLALQRAWL